MISGANVNAKTVLPWPRPINLRPGDSVIAVDDATSGDLDATYSVYLDMFVASSTPRAVTMEDPVAADEATLFYTKDELTLGRFVSVLEGSATPSITYTLRYAADRTAAGTEIITGGTTVTNTTTGLTTTVFTVPTIPADNFVWLEIAAKSGTVDSFHLTVHFA